MTPSAKSWPKRCVRQWANRPSDDAQMSRGCGVRSRHREPLRCEVNGSKDFYFSLGREPMFAQMFGKEVGDLATATPVMARTENAYISSGGGNGA
jgi:hypothetical protein